MGENQPTKRSRLSAAALAAAALLANSTAPAQSPIGDLIRRSQEQAEIAITSSPTTPAPLVLQPAHDTPSLIGYGHRSHSSHSSHASHSSHSSHYSSAGSSGGSGGYVPPPSQTPPPKKKAPPPSQNQPDPSPPPTREQPPREQPPRDVAPSDQPPTTRPAQVEETKYPYTVYMKDSRTIECDVKGDGDHYLLVKKAGTLRVLKSDVARIEKNVNATTRPSGG